MKAVKSNSDPDWGAMPSKEALVSTGVCLNGFFVFHALPYSARSRGRKWGCSEGNRDTVCNRVIDDGGLRLWVCRQAESIASED